MTFDAGGLSLVLRDLFRGDVAAHAVAFDESSIFAGDTLPPALSAAIPKRRAEFAAGRQCARAALSIAGCTSNAPIAMGAMREPVWPPGFTGSITHAAGLAAAVAAPTSAVTSLGIDLEAIVSPELAASLSDTIMRPPELALVRRHMIDRAAAFTVIFSAKEALFKCVAPLVSRYFDFLDAEVVTASPRALTLRLGRDLSDAFCAGARFDVRFAITPEVVIAGTSIRSAP